MEILGQIIRKNKTKTVSQVLYNNPSNNWILQDKDIKKRFDYLINLINAMPSEDTLKVIGLKSLHIVPISGNYALSIQTKKEMNLIAISPALKQLLSSAAWSKGLAIVAHEIGHLAYQHSQRKITALEAQVEADHFAYKLGLGEELLELLEEEHFSIEQRTRITYISARIFSNA